MIPVNMLKTPCFIIVIIHNPMTRLDFSFGHSINKLSKTLIAHFYLSFFTHMVLAVITSALL